jgi:hypothetical protein
MIQRPAGLMMGGTKTKKGRTGWTLPFSLEGLLWKLGFNSASS